MIAKHAWLTTPEPGRYILNFQLFGSEEVTVIEVGPDHMRNIVADGVHNLLRNSYHRVPVTTNRENADERAGA